MSNIRLRSYSAWDTMVGFVIFCVLKVAWIWLDLEEYYWPISKIWDFSELILNCEQKVKSNRNRKTTYIFTVKTVKDLSSSFMDGPLGAKNKSKMAATERILKWLFPFALLMGSTKSLPDVIKIGKTYCFWSMLNTQIIHFLRLLKIRLNYMLCFYSI